jgi:NAD(P)-dependent dehydrogenase (short-subunit alcohol dehydrogenase family)
MALTYSTNQHAVEELVAQLEKEYHEVRPENRFPFITIHQVDLASVERTIRLYDDIRKMHGRPVDILISNAGYGRRIPDIWYVSGCVRVMISKDYRTNLEVGIFHSKNLSTQLMLIYVRRSSSSKESSTK